jgi:leader peptidase (prepilin peptidase)/N-methyltransferase
MIELFVESPAVFIAVVFAFALVIGSFLNVVIFRLPIMMEREWRAQAEEIASLPATDLPDGRFNLLLPRSRCPSCGKEIKPWQNIPVLSYLLLGAQCANCQTSISARYPLVEMGTAVLAAIAAWRFGFGWEALMAVTMTFALVTVSMIDFDHQIIPDSIVMPLLWVGLLMSLLHPFGGAETLFMGAWLGWQALPTIILMSAVVGAIIGIGLIVIRGRDRQLPIPFGPYLATAGWIAMLYGESIKNAYLDSFI